MKSQKKQRRSLPGSGNVRKFPLNACAHCDSVLLPFLLHLEEYELSHPEPRLIPADWKADEMAFEPSLFSSSLHLVAY